MLSGPRSRPFCVCAGSFVWRIEDMEESIINALRDWAASKSFIIRLWVFGSRAKKKHHEDSDLDIVAQIGRTESFYGPSEAWLCRRDRWESELQERLPMKPHLLPLGHTKATRVVRKYWQLLYVHPAHARDAIPSQESFDAAESIATTANQITELDQS